MELFKRISAVTKLHSPDQLRSLLPKPNTERAEELRQIMNAKSPPLGRVNILVHACHVDSPMVAAEYVEAYHETIRLLLEFKADASAVVHIYSSPLQIVRTLHGAQLLLAAKADIDSQDNLGWTALMGHLQNERDDIALALMKRGADPFLETAGGFTIIDKCTASSPLRPRLKAYIQERFMSIWLLVDSRMPPGLLRVVLDYIMHLELSVT